VDKTEKPLSVRCYHFTGADHAIAIEQEGITLGRIFDAYARPPRILDGVQWLTLDNRFTAQHWATNVSKQCGDRTAVRLEVDIPFDMADTLLLPWNTVARKVLNWNKRQLQEFNLAGGSTGEQWLIFFGHISPKWLVQRVDKAFPDFPRLLRGAR
jgi:hypothetical protein